MNLMDLQNQIKEKNINNSYIFIGDEIGIMNKYIEFIANLKKLGVKRVYTFAEIENDLKSQNLFNNSYIYYIYNDSSLYTNDYFIDYFNSDNFNGNIIILRFDKVDSRKKLIKDFERVVSFGKLNEEILAIYIKEYFDKVSKDNISKLVSYCDRDYERIINECEKIKVIKELYKYNDDIAFNNFFDNKIIYDNKNEIVFDIVDMAMFKDYTNFYENLKRTEDYTLILSLIGTYIFNLLSYKSLKADSDFGISKKSGIPLFIVKKLRIVSEYHSIKKCLKLVDEIRAIEMKIKNGKVEDKIGLLYIISILFKG